MNTQKTLMNRGITVRCLSALLVGGACLVLGSAAAPVSAEPTTAAKPATETPAAKPAAVTAIKGTCKFGGKESTWSATLTPKGDGTYDAVYVSTWGGAPLNYVGTIKTDAGTEISGDGKASGGRANGTFEFSGKYGTNGIAQCSYKEVGPRGRSGTMTAELPK